MYVLHFALQICIFGYVCGIMSQGTRIVLNKRSVKSRAFNRACKMHSCRNTECTIEDGWGIYGSDSGCCENYDGCCKTASVVCYLHDVMCKCCDYGWMFCGPECRREPDCDNKVENNDIDTATRDLKSDMGENNKSQNALHNHVTSDQSQNGLQQSGDRQSKGNLHLQTANKNKTYESNSITLNGTSDCAQNGTCFNDSSYSNIDNSTFTQYHNRTANHSDSTEIISVTDITKDQNGKSLKSGENQTVDSKTASELSEDGFIKYPPKYTKKKHRVISNNIVNKVFKTVLNNSKFSNPPFGFTRGEIYDVKNENREGSGDID